MTLKGRENEYKIIKSKITNFLSSKKGSTVYISGVPGSGKTYTIKNVFEGIEHIYINSANLAKKHSVYSLIYKNLKCKTKIKDPKIKHLSFLEKLKFHLQNCNENHIVIIDEIDMLLNKKQDILYNLFELPYLKKCNFLLIVISNTMSLLNSIDAKILSRIGNERINFVPYTHSQLMEILEQKGVSKDSMDLICRRVGGISGDVRRAMNILERVKDENHKKTSVSIFDVDETMKKMFKPLSQTFLMNLPKYQKIVVIVLQEKDKIEIHELFEDVMSFLKIKNIEVFSYFDFLKIISALKGYGIIKIRASSISSNLLKEEIKNGLRDDDLYKKLTIK